MPRRRARKTEYAKPPKDLAQLSKLIEQGKLFAVQDWIKAGWRVQDDPNEWVQVKVLFGAVAMLALVGTTEINGPPGNSCPVLEQLVSYHPCYDHHTMAPFPEDGYHIFDSDSE